MKYAPCSTLWAASDLPRTDRRGVGDEARRQFPHPRVEQTLAEAMALAGAAGIAPEAAFDVIENQRRRRADAFLSPRLSISKRRRTRSPSRCRWQ